MEPYVYFLSSALSLRKLRQCLPPESPYRIFLEQGELQPAVLLDTFDNSLFLAGKLLLEINQQLLLVDLENGQLLEQTVSPGQPVIGAMAKGPVVDMLSEISKLRALLPVATVRARKEDGRVLDDEGKTLVRFDHLAIGRGRRRLTGVGCVRYLRGYSEAYTDLCQWLESCGAVACSNAGDVCAALGIALNPYNAKPEVELLPDAPVKESATILLRTFLGIARKNEPGIVADGDTEFLHDYRVCLRKIRSVLSLFSGVFDARDGSRLKQQLATVMRTTNGLRDLDVYLLNREQYLAMVPPSAQNGLQVLFEGLAQKRKAEQKKVSTVLQGKSYQKSMESLEKVFAGDEEIRSGPRAEERSMPFACRLIIKRYRRVCKIGRDIDDTTPDPVIHQLRIHCKKLRYLMEFFAPLFPAGEIKQLIRSLKTLQDNLGNFNDYSIQQQFLDKVLAGEMIGGVKSMAVAHAIGALTAMLYQLQGEERSQIMENLGGFDSPDIRESFKELFFTEDEADENNSLLQ